MGYSEFDIVIYAQKTGVQIMHDNGGFCENVEKFRYCA